MNRQDRRREALERRRAERRGATPPLECVFESEADPEKPGYAWFNIMLPAPGIPTAAYTGDAAIERFQRFVEGFTRGATERLLEGHPLLPVELVGLDALHADAAAHRGVAVAGIFRAWLLTLTCVPRPGVLLADGMVVGQPHDWQLVAQLWPRGRGSAAATWRDLGHLAAAVAARTDGPTEPPPPASVRTAPNAPHAYAPWRATPWLDRRPAS